MLCVDWLPAITSMLHLMVILKFTEQCASNTSKLYSPGRAVGIHTGVSDLWHPP